MYGKERMKGKKSAKEKMIKEKEVKKKKLQSLCTA